MVVSQNTEPIGIHIIGGLGDAARRSILAIYKSDLAKSFYIKSLSDVYPASEVQSRPQSLLAQINTRLREPMDPVIQEFLAKALAGRIINYFQISRENQELPQALFDQITSNDLVNISVPNKLHIPYLKQCLMNRPEGNFLVEKPLASTFGETIEIQEFMERYGYQGTLIKDVEHYSHYPNVIHFVNNFRRYSPQVGRVKRIEMHIEESEGFDNYRNRDVINKNKSGNGIWLDMGVHTIAFLRAIGASIDFNGLEAKAYKSDHPEIQGDEFGETAMDVRGSVVPNEYFAPGCQLKISVGKGLPKQDKRFVIEYEDGGAEIKIKQKHLSVWNHVPIEDLSFKQDPFYMVFKNMEGCIRYGEKPITPLNNAIQNVRDVFRVYDHVVNN